MNCLIRLSRWPVHIPGSTKLCLNWTCCKLRVANKHLNSMWLIYSALQCITLGFIVLINLDSWQSQYVDHYVLVLYSLNVVWALGAIPHIWRDTCVCLSMSDMFLIWVRTNCINLRVSRNLGFSRFCTIKQTKSCRLSCNSLLC